MTITIASTDSTGTLGNGVSSQSTLLAASQFSADGRYVVFQSSATNLVPGDTNGQTDVFLRDLTTGQVTRVSTTATGAQATGGTSGTPSISADGRYVAFASAANNLVPGDTNGLADIFVKDLLTGAITRVNVAADGTQAIGGLSNASAISANGQFVVFQSQATNLVSGDTNGTADLFVKNLATGEITRVDTMADGSQVRLGATVGTISADGRYVAFQSNATDLVTGDTNGRTDIFVKDLQTGAVTLVSTAANGGQGGGDSTFADISANGRFVVFQSNSQELVPGDTNGIDFFVKDLQTGAITRVNTAADGTQANSQAIIGASTASISADGRYVTFASSATNLVPGDTNRTADVFVKDLLTGEITRLSVADNGTEANALSSNPVISPDGHYVIFSSGATNLVPGDTNGRQDMFVANACYCTGTLILTSRGEVPVEALSIGDVVVTAAGAHRPIRWIGHRKTEIARHPEPIRVRPVRIKAGAIAPGIPVRDLRVSPDHAVAIDGVLVKAARLVNGVSIVRESIPSITYWHVELDSHDLLIADGMPAESYIEAENRQAFDNAGSVIQAYPDFEAKGDYASRTCLPLVEGGDQLKAIRAGLFARIADRFTADPDVRLLVDGMTLVPTSADGRHFRFEIPEGVTSLRLVSRSAIASEVQADSRDHRRFGILIRKLMIDGLAADFDALGDGWLKQVLGCDHRWTDGDADLPIGRSVTFQTASLDRYPPAEGVAEEDLYRVA